MTRMLKVKRNGPYRVRKEDVDGDDAWICGCGLSANKPFCDSSHATARRESADRLVYYPGNMDENPPRDIDPALFPQEGTP